MQSISVFPMMQMADFYEQYRLQLFTPFVDQANTLSDAMAGVGSMGVVAARPEIMEGFDEQEMPWSPVQPEPESGFDDTEGNWWLINRAYDRSSDILLVVVAETAGGTVTYLSQVYPNHQPLIAYAGYTVGAVIQISLILALGDN